MAVESRRFIPYAIIFSTISCAVYLKRFFNHIKFPRIVATIIQLTLLIFSLKLLWVSIEQYPKNNIAENNGNFYERMFFIRAENPVNLANFITLNKITGNLFNNWTWEGYLRYHCPGIKVFCGGRAHQIYNNAIFKTYNRMLDADPPLRCLENVHTSYIAVPARRKFGYLIKSLCVDTTWEILYADDRDLLFANKNCIGETLFKSNLIYPNMESERLTSFARIIRFAGQDTSAKYAQTDSILRNDFVCPWYYFFKTQHFADARDKGKFEGFLLSYLDHFASIAQGNSKGLSILESTEDILQALIDYYKGTDHPEKINNLIPYLGISEKIPIVR